jgi:hypothetical protein
VRRAARQMRSQAISLPAPVKGIVENAPIALADPLAAEHVENFLPTERGFKARGGISRAAYVTDAVKTLFNFKAVSEDFFAATQDAIYEISSLNPATAPAPAVSGMTSGDWSVQQIGVSGGDYLMAVNGADLGHIYDGSTWTPWTDEAVNQLSYDGLTTDFAIGETVTGGTSGASAEIIGVVQSTANTGILKLGAVTSGPFQDDEAITSAGGAAVANGANSAASSITLAGVASSALSHVWLYKSRLFFIEKDTLTAWYLPSAVVGGTAADISLAGVFRRGGTLLMGATWSLDSGDGIDDKCVFVSTEGEVAVYAGDDPSDANAWALEGRYDIGKPLAKRAVMRAGGDVLIATDDGIVPLSQVVQKDPAALSLAAVTRTIRDTWREEISRDTAGAELWKWTGENLGLVVLPQASRMLTVNLQTGAWAEQSGWFGDCAGEFNGAIYVGREDGRVYKINDTGTDDGAAFVCKLCYSFLDGGDAATYKVVNLARAAWFAIGAFAYRLGVATDYKVTFPAAPSAVDPNLAVSTDVWGTGEWGGATWGGTTSDPPVGRQDQWRAVSGSGFALAPTVVLTSGSAEKLNVEFLRVDLNMEMGGRAA